MLRRYLHADPRGSIVAVTDHTGNRIATNTYDEYGIPDAATGNDIATKGRFRYTGQAWIPELGMYYYKARIYSPTLGRFLQTDPIGYEDQFNLYAYVGNDPINLTDPTGLCPICLLPLVATPEIIVGAAGLSLLAVAATNYPYVDDVHINGDGSVTITDYGPYRGTVTNSSGLTGVVVTDDSPLTGTVTYDTAEWRNGEYIGPNDGGVNGPQGGTVSEARRRGAPHRCIEPLCDAPHGGSTETGRCPDCEGKKRRSEGRPEDWWNDDDRDKEKKNRYPRRDELE